MADAPDLIIVNPCAHYIARNPGIADELQRCLREHGVRAEMHVTQAAGEATEVAREAARAGRGRVIVAGGDGTVNEVIRGLEGTETALGLAPLGTGNALGHTLGLRPGDVAGACRLIADGRARRVDLGSMNGRLFACMAGVGLDAQVAADIRPGMRAVLGRHAFVTRFLHTVARLRPWQACITVDDRELDGPIWAVFVCNTPQYTWRVSMVPQARMDDGELDFALFRACSRMRLLGTAAAIFARGRPASEQPTMEVLRGRRLRVECDPAAPWQADGEVGGNTPVECEARPAALRLIGPPGDG